MYKFIIAIVSDTIHRISQNSGDDPMGP